MLGTQTQGGRIVGTAKSTESFKVYLYGKITQMWRINLINCVSYFITFLASCFQIRENLATVRNSLPALLCKTISDLRPNFCMHSCISSTDLLHCLSWVKGTILSTFHSTYHQNSTSCLPQLWSEIGKNSTLTSKFKLACVSRKMRGYFFRKTKTKYSRGDIFHSEIVPLGENEP